MLETMVLVYHILTGIVIVIVIVVIKSLEVLFFHIIYFYNIKINRDEQILLVLINIIIS